MFFFCKRCILFFNFVTILLNYKLQEDNNVNDLSLFVGAAIDLLTASFCLSCSFLQLFFIYLLQWAFIYVGLYGMPYLKAGKSVFELFGNRGWEAVIADDLIGNTLFLVSLVIGGLMGAIGIIIDVSSDLLVDAGGSSRGIAFGLGFIIGFVITSILMSTIASSVNAIIVLFAEAPNDFQRNHPELSQRMREIWNEVYPGSVS
jgi:Plasma-membrane choline transporter